MQTGKRIVAVILSFGFVLVTNLNPAYAHSGRTDRSGCHNVTADGTRHCHYGGGYSGGGSSGEDFLIAASIIVGVVIVFWVLRNCDRDLNLHEEIQTAKPRLAPFYDIEEDKFGLKFAAPF